MQGPSSSQHSHTGPLQHIPQGMIANAMANQIGALGFPNVPGVTHHDPRSAGPGQAAAGAGTTSTTVVLAGEQAVHGGRFDFDDG